ncbi:hypothetical protein [Flavobacterium sp.]|uniref:hypothetical protein n=1 Tax=Flavobacterium sp. TaxID=239 RepID=UPI00260D30D7|nr:hypothetical protein [Flavobacterium sp.]
MKKSILSLKGAKELNAQEQKSVLGGACPCEGRCPAGYECYGKCGCRCISGYC